MNDFDGKIASNWLERAESVLVQARKIRAILDERTARFGLGEPELALLWACVDSPPGGRGQRELADCLAVSAAQVSVLVERLSNAGVLQGHVDPNDRRRKIWETTPAGRAIWGAIAESFNDLDQHRGAA